MRRGLLLALLVAGCVPATERRGGQAGPRSGIVSTNPCVDAILVRLVDPSRIVALSRYSQDPDATSMPLTVARRFRVTAGTAEEVIALNPALVLADSFAPATTLAAYRQAGLRTVVPGSPTSVAASVAQVREVAAAVGEAGRGEALVREIEGSLGRPASGTKPSALFFITGDLASGSGNLLDELLTRAGFRNAAADYGLAYTGTIPLETQVARPPDVVISTGFGRSAALRARLLPQVRLASFPRTLVNCGGPSIAPAMARLRAIRTSL